MTIADLSHALQSLGPMTYIRESGYTYPMILATHLATICVFGGLILMTDLRLLGLALRDMPAGDVIKQLRVWKRVGFCIMVTAGLLLGTSEMDKYYNNPYFLMKMTLLLILFPLHAIIFHKSVYANPEALNKASEMPPVAKAAAITSLCIWIGIACCGRWIAYYEPDKKKNKAAEASLVVPAHAAIVASVQVRH